jgi:hypothetical protein
MLDDEQSTVNSDVVSEKTSFETIIPRPPKEHSGDFLAEILAAENSTAREDTVNAGTTSNDATIDDDSQRRGIEITHELAGCQAVATGSWAPEFSVSLQHNQEQLKHIIQSWHQWNNDHTRHRAMTLQPVLRGRSLEAAQRFFVEIAE